MIAAAPIARDRGEPELALQRLEIAEMLVAEQRLGFVMEPQFLRGAALSAHGAFDARRSRACARHLPAASVRKRFALRIYPARRGPGEPGSASRGYRCGEGRD
jgi:hypothetical protein